MWPQATAAEETVLRIESRPGATEVMVLTPGRDARESASGQGSARNAVIVIEGGSGQAWIGRTTDGPDAGKLKLGGQRGA